MSTHFFSEFLADSDFSNRNILILIRNQLDREISASIRNHQEHHRTIGIQSTYTNLEHCDCINIRIQNRIRRAVIKELNKILNQNNNFRGSN